MSKVFIPYNLALELDKFYQMKDQGALDSEQFYNIVETLQTTGSEKNQKETVELFKRLSKTEVINRAATVVRLNKLLITMRANRKM